jgi:hypothetical protein
MSVVRLILTSIAVVLALGAWHASADAPPYTVKISEAATAEYRQYLEMLTRFKGHPVHAALAVSIDGEVTFSLRCEGAICAEVDIPAAVLKECRRKADSECVVALIGEKVVVTLIPYQN